MINGRSLYRINNRTLLILICLLTLLSINSCASREAKARKAVEDHLKSQGIRDLKVDIFHLSKDYPDKAYISVTVTHNYATSDGSLQREMLGYILKQEGKNYAIEQNTSYTKDQQKAESLLSGKK